MWKLCGAFGFTVLVMLKFPPPNALAATGVQFVNASATFGFRSAIVITVFDFAMIFQVTAPASDDKNVAGTTPNWCRSS